MKHILLFHVHDNDNTRERKETAHRAIYFVICLVIPCLERLYNMKSVGFCDNIKQEAQGGAHQIALSGDYVKIFIWMTLILSAETTG